MIYTDLTKKALVLMFELHKQQLDKGFMPYVFHPYHIAEEMDDEASVCVALLHDVLEDSQITASYLKGAGFTCEIVDAIVLLTHDKSIPYLDYIEAIKSNPLATKVKIADLKHNCDLSRLDNPTEEDMARVRKYKMALSILEKS